MKLELLDKAIARIKIYSSRADFKEIHLDPDTWRNATCAMEILSGISDLPGDSLFGIPVITDPDLPEDEMIIYFNEEKYIKIKNLRRE